MLSFYKVVILTILFLSLVIPNITAQMTGINLPKPQLAKSKALKENIQQRYSNRSFNSKKPLAIEQLSDILWATCGKKITSEGIDAITSATYTIPSAGAIYSLEIFVVIGKGGVTNLEKGIYYYIKEKHSLKLISNVDKRGDLALACLNQKFIELAPISIIIAANTDSMQRRYGSRAQRYAILEAGHAAQNLYLIVNDLGLSTVETGAFNDQEVSQILNIDYPPLLVMPVGYKE